MGVRLSHDQVAAQRIEFATLVAEHDACRYSDAAHQDRESRRVVLAKTAPGFEQEAVHGIAAERWRFQSVVELFLVEHAEHGVDKGDVVSGQDDVDELLSSLGF